MLETSPSKKLIIHLVPRNMHIYDFGHCIQRNVRFKFETSLILCSKFESLNCWIVDSSYTEI